LPKKNNAGKQEGKQICTPSNEPLMISIEGLSPYMAGSLEQVTLNRPFQMPTCSRLQALGNKRKDDTSGTDNSGLDKNIAKSKGLAIRGSEAWNAHLKQGLQEVTESAEHAGQASSRSYASTITKLVPPKSGQEQQTDSEEKLKKVYKVLNITGSADTFRNAGMGECKSSAPAAVPKGYPARSKQREELK
jgi:hypothetical protein